MRVFSLLLSTLCITAAIGVSVARADEDGWQRRHEWREHHWRGEEREHNAWSQPRYVYVEPPAIYYPPPPAYYESAPDEFPRGVFSFGGAHEDDEE
jgi:hypothetical protein